MAAPEVDVDQALVNHPAYRIARKSLRSVTWPKEF